MGRMGVGCASHAIEDEVQNMHENSEDIQETYRVAGHAGGYE